MIIEVKVALYKIKLYTLLLFHIKCNRTIISFSICHYAILAYYILLTISRQWTHIVEQKYCCEFLNVTYFLCTFPKMAQNTFRKSICMHRIRLTKRKMFNESTVRKLKITGLNFPIQGFNEYMCCSKYKIDNNNNEKEFKAPFATHDLRNKLWKYMKEGLFALDFVLALPILNTYDARIYLWLYNFPSP